MLAALFFFNGTATTEIYTLSSRRSSDLFLPRERRFLVQTVLAGAGLVAALVGTIVVGTNLRSEEHTSELQSHVNLVCRLLLEKKKRTKTPGCGRADAASSQPTAAVSSER